MKEENFLSIIGKHQAHQGGLISILEDIQKKDGYLQEQALRIVAQETGFSLVDIYGIATFYKLFSLEPRGKHLLSVCSGTACHVRGAERLKERLEEQLGIKAGKTTEDMRYTLETVRCIGCCSLGPVATVNEKTYARTDQEKIIKVLELYE